MGTLPLSFLFSTDRSPSPLVALFAGAFGSGGATRIPRNLLLLPQGVLPGILPRSTGLRSERRRQAEVPWRNRISLHSAKSPSLVSLSRNRLSRLSLAGRDSRILLCGRIWHRRRLSDTAGKHRPAHPLHLFLPFAASPRGRKA